MAVPSFPASPKVCRHRRFYTFFKTNCVLLADRTADPTPVTTPLIDGGFLVRCAIRYGAELADTHALPAAIAQIRIDNSHIF